MKRLLIAAALSGIASGAFAQGTVFFNNNSLSQPAIDIIGLSGKQLAPAGQFTVALYWLNQSSGPLTPIDLGTTTPLVIMTGNARGGFDFGNAVTIPGQTAGGVGEFQVAAWWGTEFSSFTAAYFNGVNLVATNQPFYNGTGGNGTPATIAQQLTGWAGQPDLVMDLTAGPEPSTITLGGLGAVALLLFGRRQHSNWKKPV